ncbi:MAG: hypothetical protein ACT4NU_12535 [Chromatiales bacterium]
MARAHTRARFAPLTYEQILFELFALDAGIDTDVPAAAATHWLDFDGDHDGFWLRADPVHLRPDLGRLLLFDANSFPLDLEEARSLIAELNAHLAKIGLQLEVGSEAKRWYLRLSTPPQLRTMPPYRASGLHIDDFLPRGEDAARWQVLGNELQMLLHQSPINIARDQRGEPPINSVWFWGAGTFAPGRARDWTIVVSDEPMALGLARCSGCPVLKPSASAADALPREGSCLVALPWGACAWRRDDIDGWREALRTLEEEWLRPLVSALRRQRVKQVTIHGADAVHKITPADRWRFWPWRAAR